MLTVGVDTYITMDAAEELIRWEPRGAEWFVLPLEHREHLMRKAARAIDAAPLSGCKASPSQDMAFPRSGGGDAVPERIKIAQALEAFALSDAQAELRAELQAQGVASVSIGKASESYTGRSAAARYGIRSKDALQLLRPYLIGGAPIT